MEESEPEPVSATDLRSLLERTCDIVAIAGRRAEEQWGRVASETKPDSSLVTEVDRQTEVFLSDELRRALPNSGFAGEEFGRSSDGDRYVWVCDPIDGTTNFVRGLPHWCVSVGLLDGGEPVMGVVFAPALDTTYAAYAGGGAWRDGVRIACLAPTVLEYEDLVCVSTNALKTLNLSRLVTRLRCLGSIALETCLVAEGRVVASVGIGEGIHDLAASLCITREACAATTYLDGRVLDPAKLLQDWRTTEHFITASEPVRELVRRAAI